MERGGGRHCSRNQKDVTRFLTPVLLTIIMNTMFMLPYNGVILDVFIPGSSRQGVGTVLASSNVAASLLVIDKLCTPMIGCLLGLSPW